MSSHPINVRAVDFVILIWRMVWLLSLGRGRKILKKLFFTRWRVDFLEKVDEKRKIISEYCAGELFFGRTVLKNKKSLNHKR